MGGAAGCPAVPRDDLAWKSNKAQTILEVCFGSALYMLQGAAWEVYAIEIRRRGKSALALPMATELDTIRTVA